MHENPEWRPMRNARGRHRAIQELSESGRGADGVGGRAAAPGYRRPPEVLLKLLLRGLLRIPSCVLLLLLPIYYPSR